MSGDVVVIGLGNSYRRDDGVGPAVVVDAAVATPSMPGRINRCTINQLEGASAVSSHGVDIATVLALGEALDRMPADVVLFAIR
jgi:hydrogenase maturation protease